MNGTKMDVNPAQNQPGMQKTPRMIWSESIMQLNSLLIPSKEIVVVVDESAGIDEIFGSLALGRGLNKIGRRTHCMSPKPIAVQDLLAKTQNQDLIKNIPNDNQFLQTLQQKQLTITLDYTQGNYAQVKTEKTGEGLAVKILPQEGSEAIEPVNYNVEEMDNRPDLAIFVGVENPYNLGELYSANSEFFSTVPQVNIDNKPTNTKHGRVNLLDQTAGSICEMITLMMYDLKFGFDMESANLLLEGMREKTGNFSQQFFSANMLEATSICFRTIEAAIKRQ